jgi:hypothetical protein
MATSVTYMAGDDWLEELPRKFSQLQPLEAAPGSKTLAHDGFPLASVVRRHRPAVVAA